MTYSMTEKAGSNYVAAVQGQSRRAGLAASNQAAPVLQ